MTLLGFAFGAGVLATVNPCGFAMLPAFLGYYLGTDRADDRGKGGLTQVGQGFAVGLAVSAGFAGVFVVIGGLVAVGLRQLTQAVPWVAVAIGALLVVAGLLVVSGREIGPRLGRGFGSNAGRGWRQMALFGGAYAVASLSCTLGVLLAVVAQAVATASPLQVLVVFAAYAAGAATVLVALALAAALAKAKLAELVGRLVPVVTRIGGVLLVGSGGYLIAYWLPTVLGGDPALALRRVTEGPSAGLTEFLGNHLGAVAAVAVVLLATGTCTLLVRRRHQRRT
jgi:cytochrome c-type biogenesis protein